jgi:hypothetical protein
MALELAIIGVVVGAVLGLRYNVLVLVPAVMFAMLFAAIVGVARADSFWSIVLMTAALAVAVQLGYLAGATIYAAVEAFWTAVVKGKDGNPELSSLGPAWQHMPQPHSWRLDPWAPLDSIERLRQPPPPQV